MKNIIRLDSQQGDLYVAWLNSGHMCGVYGYADEFTAVDDKSLSHSVESSSELKEHVQKMGKQKLF